MTEKANGLSEEMARGVTTISEGEVRIWVCAGISGGMALSARCL